MPIRKSTPSFDLTHCTYLVWGSPKCGKTTFASRFPGVAFIATEDGMKGVEAMRWETEDGRYVVRTWQELLDATKELLSSTPRPTSIAIDTLDNACLLLEDHFCKKYEVEFKNDGDLGFGKGTSIINSELRRYLLKLSSCGVGIILISHTKTNTKKQKKGEVSVDMPSIDDPDRDEDYEDCEPLDEQLNRLLRDAAPCDRGMLIILEELDANRT